jgi:hypothetical protein
MAKIADVKLLWTRSPSGNVSKVEVETTVNGNTTKVDLSPEVESLQITVAAKSTVSFKVITYGDDPNDVATSETYTFTLGDLEAVLPATMLGHEVVATRDDTQETVEPARRRRGQTDQG